MVLDTIHIPKSITQEPTYGMGSNSPLSNFKLKLGLMPNEEIGILRMQLVKRPDSSSMGYRCGSPLVRCISFKRIQVEDLPKLEQKILVNFMREIGNCGKFGKIRIADIEFLSSSYPKMTSR